MDIDRLVEDFIKVAELAGTIIPIDNIKVQVQHAPHLKPRHLPEDTYAAYIFLWKEKCLKVGVVGNKSSARFISQHYNPKSSKSNLAKSILSQKEQLGLQNLINEKNVRNWILENTDRVDILIDKSLGICIRNLLESFLHCRLDPLFEGFERLTS